MIRLISLAAVVLGAAADPETKILEEENMALRRELAQLEAAAASHQQNEQSAMAAIISEMAKPVLLSDFDRIGFIRLRKVASTTTHFFLSSALHYENCLLSQCLYGTGQKAFSCPEGKEDKYQCNHDVPARIEQRFELEKAAWMTTPTVASQKKEIAQSRLYKVVVLRDPAMRILSDYFYTLKGSWQPEQFQIWIDMYPEAYQAIQDKDFRKYVQIPSDNLNDMTLQMAPSGRRKRHADAEALAEAMGELRRCKVVLLTEYMPQGLMMLEHVFGVNVRNPDQYTKKVRVSKENAERDAIEKDPELMDLARKGGWADTILYEEAKRLFFSTFAAFLHQRGEKFTNLQEALDKYANGPITATPVAKGAQPQAATKTKTEL